MLYQTELVRGVNGRGETIYSLFVMDDGKTVAIHHFATKAEALAFHRSSTTYGPLDDWS